MMMLCVMMADDGGMSVMILVAFVSVFFILLLLLSLCARDESLSLKIHCIYGILNKLDSVFPSFSLDLSSSLSISLFLSA